MERSDLELVLAIRQHGSMTTAARALRLAPSVVTKRLAALEAQLDLRLFQRSTRHVSPTPEGDTLCERAAELLRGFRDVEAELRERQAEPTGLVRLAATFGFGRLWLGPALAEFQARHPRLQIQLQLTEQLPDLAVEGLDGAIWLWNAPGHRATEWVSRRLARNQRVLVAAPAYLRTHGTPATPEELAQHACLIVRENSSDPGQRFDSWQLQGTATRGPRLRVAVRGPLSSNSGELVRDWCLAGHGIMLRSLWDIAPRLASGELVRVLPQYVMPDADIHWLAPYRPQVPRRIRLLVDFLAQEFRAEPWRAAARPA
ncbi:LysR family transcriptional regulator [Ramlibacter sp. 2FC]|uniref:LysR family transcriptional regulator n=1 Tax=Ramlibacter sp. 2FC TaxID=2502188 RepID=UPI0010F438FD|nr:LysR family transcriptional regulator [Ramlibacter sp. 2FC]